MTDPIQQSQPTASAPPPQPAVLAVNDPRRKSPFLACLLSAMPGLGQVYTGYYQRGFAHAIIVAVIIAFLAGNQVGPLTPLAALFLAFFWLYNIVDAGRRAALFNEVLAGRTGVELPEDIKMPGMGGSVVGGITIALIGFILLLQTRFDVSLDWLEEWWPMALIAFGGYLVYKAREEKAAAHKAAASSWDEDGEE